MKSEFEEYFNFYFCEKYILLSLRVQKNQNKILELSILNFEKKFKMNLFWTNQKIGELNVSCYRIPVVIKTKNSLLAFCEARISDYSDSGRIIPVFKKSIDCGKTWSQTKIIVNSSGTMGNPCCVVDNNNVVHLFLTHNTENLDEHKIIRGEGIRMPYYTFSKDEGETWNELQKMDHLRKSDWNWYATGPGNGISLNNNRLLIPCNHTCFNIHRSHYIYSDDFGKNWILSECKCPEYSNESLFVQLPNGDIIHNMRHIDEYYRLISISKDMGNTFISLPNAYECAICQGSSIMFNDLLLFSIPKNTNRTKLVIFMIKDNNPTFFTVYEGSVGYSSLIKLNNDKIGILYERDDYNKISFDIISYDELINGKKFNQWVINDEIIDDELSSYLDNMFIHKINELTNEYVTFKNKTYLISFSKMELLLVNKFFIVERDINKFECLKIKRLEN